MPCAFFPFVRGHIKPGYKTPTTSSRMRFFGIAFEIDCRKIVLFLPLFFHCMSFFPEQAARNQMKE
jgi:hypothetical protein